MFIFVVFAIIGFGLAGYGTVSLVRTRNFLGGAQRTEGSIVDWREERYRAGDARRRSLYPTLRFRAPDGSLVETEADVPVNYPPADPEAPVSVLFDPADPRRARLSTVEGRGYAESLLFLVGGLLLAVGPYLLART